MLRRDSWWRPLLIAGIALSVVVFQHWDPANLYSRLQTSVWNNYQALSVERFGIQKDKALLTIVQIDNRSLNEVWSKYGEEWPWSRQRYVQLLLMLFEHYNVKVVGMDMFMPQARDAEGNTALQAVAQKHKLVLPEIFSLENFDEPLATGQLGGGFTAANTTNVALLPQATGYIGLTPQLATISCIGHITPVKDKNTGLITKVPPLIQWQGRIYPMLALEMLICDTENPYKWSIQPQANGWDLHLKDLLYEGTEHHLILDKQGLLRVPYRIATNNLTAVSAIDVLQGTVPLEKLDNQMVLVAGTAAGLGDEQATPVDHHAAGVSVHAQLLQWLLEVEEGKVNAPPFSLTIVAWGMGVLALVLLYWLLNTGISAGLVVLSAVGLSLLWWVASFGIWISYHWFVPIHPLVLLASFLSIQVPLEWLYAQRTSGRLGKLFSDYLPAPLVEHIVNDNRTDLLRPTRRCLSIIFADIANFTQRAEHTEPEVLAALTQQLLECLTAVAHQHEGTVDKYMGDAVLVFWNAPFDQPDHADKAVAAAIEMMQAIKRFNAQASELLQGQAVAVRVGVHTGDVIVGDLGTQFRHAYTAIGDAMNVAARLQAYAREIKRHLVVSQQTVNLLQQTWPLISQGKVELKGRREAVEVYVLTTEEEMS